MVAYSCSHDQNAALSVDNSMRPHINAGYSKLLTNDLAICFLCCETLKKNFGDLVSVGNTPATMQYFVLKNSVVMD